MSEKVKIQAGYKLIVKDGSNENAYLKQGTVVQLSDIAGTNNKRIHLDTPFIIDVVVE